MLLPVQPSVEEVACILQKCAKQRELGRLLRVHGYICETGLDCVAFLGSLLVLLFADLGDLCYARKILDRIENPDDCSWNAMIMGYVRWDKPHNAVSLVRKMHEDDLCHLSTGSLVLLLKSCTFLRDFENGSTIHAQIARHGLSESNVFLGCALVDMYAKCGFLSRSEDVFKKLLLRDVVSWTALIGGYLEHGHFEEVFNCARQMQDEGLSPNSFTMVCMLKACGAEKTLGKGQEVHIQIAKKGLEGEMLVGNSLVDMYAKCGCIMGACRVFQGLPARDVVSWTSLIAGYFDCGQSRDALVCYEQMQHVGCSPNAVTFFCVLKACGSLEVADKGLQVHRDIILKGCENDAHIGNTLMDMYIKCGLLAAAEVVFEKLSVQDVISFNVLIAGYAEHCTGDVVLMCFHWMENSGFALDLSTCVTIIKACVKSADTSNGKQVHAHILKSGFDKDLAVTNSLIDMYGKFGLLAEAKHVFDKLAARSLVSWNALIAGFVEHAPGDEAASFLLERMQREEICPDAVTCVCTLKLFGSLGTRLKGQEMHIKILVFGMEAELLIGNSLINLYAKCGCLAEAQAVFDRLVATDVVSWAALMAGYAQLGESKTVLICHDKMISKGIKPNATIMTCILNACSDEGLLYQGLGCLDASSLDFLFVPTLEQFTCIVDLLSRAGLVQKAIQFILEMPINPDIVVWLTVLGACRKWGNVELAKDAFENAMNLDRKNEAAYLFMYNIYTEAGMYNAACQVERSRASIALCGAAA